MRFRAIMRRKSPYVAALGAATLVAAGLTLTPTASAQSAAADCSTDPAHIASVPSPQQFFGFPLGTGQTRILTSQELIDYTHAVGAASDRVRLGVMTDSVLGTEMPYAIVSNAANVTDARLKKIADDIVSLRDPRTQTDAKAAKIAQDVPAIVYVAGNVHGGEKSGADASLQTLYELASGLSCDVKNRNDNLLTIIVPTQNPDGRDASRRQNEYGFDLNRDWFARTQKETDAKLELLRKYPPQVFIDAHEMGGRQYFFPPNADPIHHEIADQPVDWINRIGEANKAGFGFNGACGGSVTVECYFNYATYDMFYMGYGDTVPATGFGAAGMTFEKGSSSAVPDRVQQQFNTQWATTGWAAANKHEILGSYWDIWKTALAEGEQGVLEPNEVVQPTNTVQFPVPDVKIRSYFLLNDRQLGDVRKLVERLRQMDVEVYRLTKPLTVPNAKIFGGRSETDKVIPEGSYYIPMAQPQKHWIQATLGEDPYVPFPYFYDVSSWSNPLLAGVDTVYSGDVVSPQAQLVRRMEGGVAQGASKKGSFSYPLDSAAASELTFKLLGQGVALQRDLSTGVVSFSPGEIGRNDLDALATSLGVTVIGSGAAPSGTLLKTPDVGLYNGTGVSTTSGSYGEARFVLGAKWGLTLKPVTTADVNNNTAAFTERGVLLMPDGSNATGGLTAQGQANLKAWVANGGTYIGLRNQGTRVARAAGLTSTTEKTKPTGYQVIGSHFRVDTATSDAVALGRPAEDFQFNNGDPILNPSTTGTNVLTYPTDGSWWVNGTTNGADALKGSVALTNEPTGAGHAVLFAYNPLFRAYNENGIHLVANALLMPEGAATPAAQKRASARAAAPAAPAEETPLIGGEWRPFQIQVADADLARTQAVVAKYTGTATVASAAGSSYLTIPNPEGLDIHEHPFLRDLVNELNATGIPLRSVVG
uniref:M14 family zinc carboxypeptidase n=1 Tax=Herbidospora sakaeratensis TaxID=564415 RepID=UPI000B2DCC21|nr:M14 family zinc carboxypeptidase [Herbidospora sakaeratensis]